MKIYILILFTILLVGCGKHDGQTRKFDVTDEAFLVYEDIFYEELMHYTGQTFRKEIPINFHEDDDREAAYCYKYSDGTMEITIKKSFWDNAGENMRELVIMHEMGHCYLNKDHNPDISIMFFSMGAVARAYRIDRDLLLTHLFTDDPVLLEEIEELSNPWGIYFAN